MTDDKQRAEIQKIEETIRNLQKLKEQGLLPADQADASITALEKQLASYSAQLEGDGAIAQGAGAKSGGKGSILVDGDVTDAVLLTGDGNEVNIGTQPRARKESLREAYLSYVLGLTSPLALSGVVRQSASEAETRMDLSAVYTGMRSSSPIPREEFYSSVNIIKSFGDAESKIAGDVWNFVVSDDLEPKKFQVLIQTKIEEWTEEEIAKGYFTAESQLVTGLSLLWHVNTKSRLVLLGEPGSGKSTFMNFLALCMAGQTLGLEDANLSELTRPLPLDQEESTSRRGKENKQEAQPWDHGTLLPVRVILRDFAVRGLPDEGEAVSAEHIWKFIEEELEGAALSEYIPLLKKELRDQGGLLLFDGLDEVPEAERRRTQIKKAIESFVSSFPRCRFLVTSRTYAYQNQDWKLMGFTEAVLAPYTKGQIIQFVDRWYAHIARIRKQNEADAKGKAELLKRAIISNERLMGLAERPLLLTLMASLHAWRGGTLPDKREELYADAVDLLLDWWESQRVMRDSKGNVLMIQPSLAEWLKVDRKKVRDLLNQIAYEAHAGQSEIVGTADVPESNLITGLMKLSQNPDVKPARLIEYMRDRAGLLISRGVGVYTFPHRTFQEYLAACYLTDHDYPDAVARLARNDPDRWRETALLAGAKAARGAADFALWSLVDALTPEMESGQGDTRYWGTQIAGQAVVEIADLEKVSDSITAKTNRLRTRLLDIMEGNRLPAVERAQAGINLAVLGDPRFDDNKLFLPNEPLLGFIPIPKGKFLMGSDPKVDEQTDDEEQPQHDLYLHYDYYMARYPVTVAQYKLFVEQSDYEIHREVKRILKGIPNHPVVAVSLTDALEYCKWLEKKLKLLSTQRVNEVQDKDQLAFWLGLAEGRLQVMLPSEAEWEKAARGSDGRIYPWTGNFDPNKANTWDTAIRSTSTVGCFPSGASSYGVLDMSGNVWEWTCSLRHEYPYQLEKKRADLDAPRYMPHVFRGGSFFETSSGVRCAVRTGLYPNFTRNHQLGFRVVVSPMLLS